MKRRNFTCLATIVILLAMLLTACNGSSEEPSSAQTAPTQITPEKPTTIEPTTVEPTTEVKNPVTDEFTIGLFGKSSFARATWKPVPEAVYYLCKIYTVENNERVDVIEYTIMSDWYGSVVNSTEIPRGYGVEVIPQDADRQNIPTDTWLISDIFGRPDQREPYRYPSTTPEVHHLYAIYWDDLTEFDLLNCIRDDSIVTGEDGTVTFEAETPDGRTIRFIGKGVEFRNGNLVIYEEGRIWSLDALGRIIVCDLHTIGEFPADFSVCSYPMYTFTSKTSVESIDELFEGFSDGNNAIIAAKDYLRLNSYATQGNFFSLGTMRAYGLDAATIEIDKLIVYYDTKTYNTALKRLDFDRNFVKSYLPGDLYDPTRESFNLDSGIYDFYLRYYVADLDCLDPTYEFLSGIIESDRLYTVGELRDKGGNILNKETDGLEPGATIDVTIGDYTIPAPLCVLPRVDYAQTHHELVPSAYPEAKGDLNVLVVPIVWQDTPEVKTAEVMTSIYNSLGQVLSADGVVNDYSDGVVSNGYSLSEYYNAASYGQLNITSFVTDWFHLPHNASENTFALTHERAVEIINKVYDTYPDMDFSSFDKDENGYFDAVIFINVQTIGTMTMNFYTPMEAGTAQKLGINCYSNIPINGLHDNTIIHEFGHNLGLIDYYDVNYSGIDAVGRFDMQSQSVGDWNPYSKYSVGWITPEVVTDLKSGESVEIEIGAFANTGDAIVIPGAESFYNGTPFGEYILIDLFTDHGLNERDAQSYGLKDTVGVRIYHVNSVMEGRVLSLDGQELADMEGYPIGTINKANTYSGIGAYHLELVQAGGNNTFTDLKNLRVTLQKNDLFATGDVFDAAEYTEFFHNGLLDDRKDFGYIVEIVSITDGDVPTATIRITRK